MKDDSFYDYDEESGKSKEDELNDDLKQLVNQKI